METKSNKQKRNKKQKNNLPVTKQNINSLKKNKYYFILGGRRKTKTLYYQRDESGN